MDSALQMGLPEINIAPRAEVASNKRTLEMALPSAPAPPQHKRRVSMEKSPSRITLFSSCGSVSTSSLSSSSSGSLKSLVAKATSGIAPESPKSVALVPVAASPVPSKPSAVATKKTKKATKAAAVAATTSSSADGAATIAPKAPTISVRSSMTPAEKAKACRERNREHARKTRLRKKAYVDELKRSLNDMIEERDATLAAEEQKAKILEQNRDVRLQVMQDFLNLRGNNERSPSRWSAILVPEEFSLKLPKTDFQTMVDATSPLSQQVLTGVDDVMADASYFSSFLQTLGSETNEAASPVYFIYNCEDDSFLMDGSQAMINFEATTSGAIAQGAKSELVLTGTFRAKFCTETNRLRSAQMMFDTGAIRTQLASNN